MTNPVSATTGHSQVEERKVAKTLYLYIAAAVFVGILLFLGLSQRRDLNPMLNTAPQSSGVPAATEPVK